ncbi:helix-turn-helix domain-containing protein [Pedobacter sp. NJ-S-72]
MCNSFCPGLDKLFNGTTADLDHFFAGKLSRKTDSLAGMISDIEGLKPGQLSIGAIAERYAITPRQLERKFRQQTGLSPKTFINILRNRAALVAIKNRGADSLLKIAIDHGYYDHAHLSREIKRFTGTAPSLF